MADCSQGRMATVRSMPPDLYVGCVGDCGIYDLLLADDGVKVFLKTQCLKNGLNLNQNPQTAIIALVIQLCNSPADSIMAKFID
jgi:hypothetical protein